MMEMTKTMTIEPSQARSDMESWLNSMAVGICDAEEKLLVDHLRMS